MGNSWHAWNDNQLLCSLNSWRPHCKHHMKVEHTLRLSPFLWWISIAGVMASISLLHPAWIICVTSALPCHLRRGKRSLKNGCHVIIHNMFLCLAWCFLSTTFFLWQDKKRPTTTWRVKSSGNNTLLSYAIIGPLRGDMSVSRVWTLSHLQQRPFRTGITICDSWRGWTFPQM